MEGFPFHPLSSVDPQPTSAPARPLPLGVIFLTLYIDLIGFSIIFPLGPDLLEHYLKLEGHTGVLGWMVAQTDALARTAGQLWISSTGKVGDVTRTVEARVFKDGSYNYAFISNYSTFLPSYPGTYNLA